MGVVELYTRLASQELTSRRPATRAQDHLSQIAVGDHPICLHIALAEMIWRWITYGASRRFFVSISKIVLPWPNFARTSSLCRSAYQMRNPATGMKIKAKMMRAAVSGERALLRKFDTTSPDLPADKKTCIHDSECPCVFAPAGWGVATNVTSEKNLGHYY